MFVFFVLDKPMLADMDGDMTWHDMYMIDMNGEGGFFFISVLC